MTSSEHLDPAEIAPILVINQFRLGSCHLATKRVLINEYQGVRGMALSERG